MFSAELMREGEALLARCRELGLKLCTAESCTGGLVSALLTEFAGSSDVVERGFVTYSNAAKEAQLSVPAGLLVTFGAVSEEVARAMAEGGLSASPADIAIAITGIAGPGGGSAEKPVGLVYIACARREWTTICTRRLFTGLDRHGVRMAAVQAALEVAGVQLEEAGARRDSEGGP